MSHVWQFDYEITDKDVNWKLTIFGLFFLCFRIICMTPFRNPDGTFHPEVFHTSYFISILISLSMVFSFRVKILNIIPLAALPSVLFSIFGHDIQFWLHPESVGFGPHHIGDLFWWNFLTIHTPIPILALYFWYTRKETLSIESYYMMLPLFLTWFLFLDDKENGTLNGVAYVRLVLIYILIFSLLFHFIFMRKSKVGRPSPLIARVIRIKHLKLVKMSLD
ncbi:MAG: hypothetical protein ACTSU2_15870 [Promethearchaeota archaeon]